MKRRTLRCETLEERYVLDAVVVFNEVMYNPAGGNEALEWVELHNQMATDIDLSAWQIEGGIDFTFPEGRIIPGHGYLVIAADPAALSAASGFNAAIGPFGGHISNSGENLRLVDRNDRQMDEFEFKDEGDWPVGADGSGASLAKIDPDTISARPENWQASSLIGGTPGVRNSVPPGGPSTSQNLITPGAAWRYDSSGTDNGTQWRTTSFSTPVTWGTGQTMFKAGSGAVADPTISQITGVTATATTQYTADGRLAANTVNGSGLSGNLHSAAVNTMWLSNGTLVAPNDTAPEITFDLGGVYTLDRMKFWNYNEYLPSAPTRIAELLGRGVNHAKILVAGENQVFTTLVADQAFSVVTPATTGTDFSQTINFGGIAVRYIKLDIDSNHNGKNFNDPLSNDTFANFVGISEVQFFGTAVPFRTTVPLGPSTYYFRKEFTFTGDPARTQLFLNTTLDDGAVVYLNGTEVYRQNMPAGAPAYATLASTAVGNAVSTSGISISGANLISGGANVLAIEVHQAIVGDLDMVFGADMLAVISPVPAGTVENPLGFNEVAAGSAAGFFVELANRGASSLPVGGYVIQSTTGAEYVLPATSLAPGALLSVSAAQLGFTPSTGDRLFLLTPNRQTLSDAAEIKTMLRGRMTPTAKDWAYPDGPTPGAANVVTLHNEIVINEIMYSHQPTFALDPTPAVFTNTPLIPTDATWKFNRQNANLPTGWQTTNYTVDGVNWRSGQATLGVETATLPEPIRTHLGQNGMTYATSTVTYYFQKEFNFAGAPAGSTIRMRYLVDDGAIFYLNGLEIPGTRYLMPAGPVTGTTSASAPGVGDASSFSSYIDIPVNLFNVGTNIFSAEVHQLGTGSSDIVFNLELVLSQQTAPAVPGTPYSENPEEWIELYNKSNHSVDLSSWQLDDAVDYTFAAGTSLPAGGYIVVAKDAASLATKFPGITIAGSYSGTLSNQDDKIRLRDARGNTADEVHYYDGGRWDDDANGGGSSLELRDPDADNNSAEAWAASIEGDDSQWQTITYRGLAGASSTGPDGQWQEFVLGLLDEGEMLLDDISVRQMTGTGAPIQLIQNGSFETDAVGGTAAKWRILGNESHSQVIVDPTNPANKVLRLVAGGSTDHMSNHAETTLKNGAAFVTINSGLEYEISLKAKWISGSPQLNTRLYFNRLVRTSIVTPTTKHGTPGTVNSVVLPGAPAAANVGPTYEQFKHGPAVPAPFEPVTVSTIANDPDGVASMTLWYSIAGGAWTSAPMTLSAGKYSAQIPGRAAGTIVQFYAEGQDTLGAKSTFPADGRDSRALYKVNDGLAATNGLNNFRIIVTQPDGDLLHNTLNLMSNDRIGATVIYNENEIYYDVGLRLKGSEHSRTTSARLGFNVSFHSEQLFRGVHKTVAIDRSESTGFGQREMLIHQTMDHAGGILSKYHDLIQVMAPKAEHTGSAELQLARYGDEFLDEQFSNGSDGTVFEYELVYQLNSTNDGTPEGIKVPAPDSVTGTAIRDLGNEANNYRWSFLIKNNTDKDDYATIIQWAKAMQLTGTAFTNTIGNYIDVDQWLRGFALSVVSGAGDSYGGDGSQHNVQFYVRPEDNKVLFFPHDLDAFFDANRPLVPNTDLAKLITVPGNAHNFYGHVEDIISTTYNQAYMQHWADDFGALLPGQPFASHLAFIVQRGNKLLTDISSAAPPVGFNITGATPSTVAPIATVSGTGWVDVRTIRLAGDSTDLPLTWNTVTGWSVTVPVELGTHPVTLEAYDFEGKLIDDATVSVTSTVSARPLQDFLRVTELMYHPADPSAAEIAAGFTDSDEFEFIELRNISATTTIDLAPASFVTGIDYQLSAGTITSLAPGARMLIVSNPAAFQMRYGTGLPVAGEYGGQLNNGGEMLRMEDSFHLAIQEFTYDDTGAGWHPSTDGDGYSLVIINDLADTDTWNDGPSWKPSSSIGGTPGSADLLSGDFNADNRVDLHDLAILQSHLGTASGGLYANGDINGDGAINRADAAAFMLQFGHSSIPPGPSPAASAAILATRVAAPAPVSAVRRTSLAAVRSRNAQAGAAEVSAVDQALAETDISGAASLRASARRTPVASGATIRTRR